MTRTDERIKKDIVDHLYWDHHVDASDVKVGVSDGKVTLTGSVPSYSAREDATTDAWLVADVAKVNNLLAVHFPSTFTLPTDSEIQSNAENTLAWNPDVYSLDINVSVAGGTVTLEGTVDAYWEKRKAENLVSDLRGVIDVENKLAVVPSGNFVDKNIATETEAALDRNVYVDAEDVTVKVENGKVSLTGTVPSWHARWQAGDAAKYTAGVVDVQNYLIVG